MMMRLEVCRWEQSCQFKLLWGTGQQLVVSVIYPPELTARYQAWEQAYNNFYASLIVEPDATVQQSMDASMHPLRACVDVTGSGSTAAVQDWRFKLGQAEVALLGRFHRWLNEADLVPIRRQIARTATVDRALGETTPMDLCLTCEGDELERLPWETWEIGAEFGLSRPIRIARSPINIQAATVPRTRRGKPRILAIFGDETGLDFQVDRHAMRSLSRLAEIRFVTPLPTQTRQQVIEMVIAAITDEVGWDVLFFSGHSQGLTGGGEFAIAPGVLLSMQELARPLTVAKQRGLQFAVFNSCCGLRIAKSLIDLGFSQVVVMREPVHNVVAQEFLVQFLQALAVDRQDVHDALLSACQFLETRRKQAFPSAYLVPSLFRHPGSSVTQFKSINWRQRSQQWLSKRSRYIALAALAALSWQVPLQSSLGACKKITSQSSWRNGDIPFG
jgi:hypothetical protein